MNVLRRAVLAALGAALAGPRLAGAQRAGAKRIALLDHGHETQRAHLWQAFRQRLQELGHVEGRTFSIDARWAEEDSGKLQGLAEQLVRAQPAIVVTTSTPTTLAAMKATSTIPIVFVAVADPVKAGLVASLARPGGNVTGQSIVAVDTAAKRIELLLEVAPKAKRIGFLGPAGNPGVAAVHERLNEAAASRGATIRQLDAGDAPGIAAAFGNLKAERVDALVVAAILLAHREQIAELATRHRLPAIYVHRQHLDAGGLITLGPDLLPLYRRAADYVHRILQGAKPTDLPVEQANDVSLGVNLKTAKAIGIAVPQSLLVRADRVIE